MAILAVPRHLAIIMDGNGRWARSRGSERFQGHRAGIDAVRRVVRRCGERGIEHLTLFTFSSENWTRPPLEVRALMGLLVDTLGREVAELHRNRVRLSAIGDLSKLPGSTRLALERAIEETATNDGLRLHLALSYGGRWEIVEAARRLARATLQGRIDPESIDEETFSRHLQTTGIPDVDLLLRTGGEQRISNFLPWQSTYAELLFTPVLWPDFGDDHLDEALATFASRNRRFGGVAEDDG